MSREDVRLRPTPPATVSVIAHVTALFQEKVIHTRHMMEKAMAAKAIHIEGIIEHNR